jgi:hypothetical protein
VESGINNFHTGIPKSQSGYLGSAIMSIQTGFADQYFYFLYGHIDFPLMILEVVSKPQIRFKGKAQADRESAAYMGM